MNGYGSRPPTANGWIMAPRQRGQQDYKSNPRICKWFAY